MDEVANAFDDKSIVITGGTGSFGHYLVPALLQMNVRSVTVFSRDEQKQWDMQRSFPDSRLHFVIGDVRDRERVLEVLKSDYVFHAAALKIIPICEANPTEADKTNRLGSLNVRNACLSNGVGTAVFVSTDKAVKPVNTYGMTKALAEKIWLNAHVSGTRFVSVRYGNVLGSRGSIVPLIKGLLESRSPIPLTHSAMTRFLLTLEESIELVLYTAINGKDGQIIVRKSPAHKVTDLITAMAGPDYPIADLGVRPGEKINEILVSEEEITRTEDRGKYLVIHQYGEYKSDINTEFASNSVQMLNADEIRNILAKAGLL